MRVTCAAGCGKFARPRAARKGQPPRFCDECASPAAKARRYYATEAGRRQARQKRARYAATEAGRHRARQRRARYAATEAGRRRARQARARYKASAHARQVSARYKASAHGRYIIWRWQVKRSLRGYFPSGRLLMLLEAARDFRRAAYRTSRLQSKLALRAQAARAALERS